MIITLAEFTGAGIIMCWPYFEDFEQFSKRYVKYCLDKNDYRVLFGEEFINLDTQHLCDMKNIPQFLKELPTMRLI
jgi:hypothetical protein